MDLAKWRNTFPQTHGTGLEQQGKHHEVIDIHCNKAAEFIATFNCAIDFPVIWCNKAYGQDIC